MFPVDIEWFVLGPAFQDGLKRFTQPRVAVLEGKATGLNELWMGKPRAKSENETPLPHQVFDDRRLNRDVERMVQV